MSIDTSADVGEVKLPIDGALYSAPLGTTLPTSATGALNVAFTPHGYWTSDGLTEATSKTVEDIRAFQLNALVDSPVTEGTGTIQVALLQKNKENVGLYYGDTVNTTDGSVRWRPGVANGHRAFVVDKVDRDGNVERIVIEDGQVTEMGDRVTVQGSASAYPITITIYGDSATIYDETLIEP